MTRREWWLMAWVAVVVVLMSIWSPAPFAEQSPPPPPAGTVPTLTDVQKLTLQGKAKDVKIAELTVQAAVTAYKQAQAEFQAAVAAVQQPCFDLRDDLTYVPNDKKDGCKK